MHEQVSRDTCGQIKRGSTRAYLQAFSARQFLLLGIAERSVGGVVHRVMRAIDCTLRGRNIVAATPDIDLGSAIFFNCLLLIKALQATIMAARDTFENYGLVIGTCK